VKKYLNNKQIDDYQKLGVIVIKGIFKDWIETLKIGFDRVLAEPSIHGRENVTTENSGRFFEDYCNWQRIIEFKECIFKSPGAQIISEATGSKSVQLFHEHIFIKDAGTQKETPFHQDMPYYCIDGNQTGSFWIPLDKVEKNNNLKLILKSHHWSKLIKPTKWSNNKSWYSENNDFMEMPDLKKIKKDIFVPDLEIGDAVLFNFKIVHGSDSNLTSSQRRAFSMRFIGDDVKFLKRNGPTSPPFDGINLMNGDKMRADWFPEVFNS
jgi:ectoine hydroxylase-related dioxygenase (phytanoyl-CoA dioxygenase family)